MFFWDPKGGTPYPFSAFHHHKVSTSPPNSVDGHAWTPLIPFNYSEKLFMDHMHLTFKFLLLFTQILTSNLLLPNFNTRPLWCCVLASWITDSPHLSLLLPCDNHVAREARLLGPSRSSQSQSPHVILLPRRLTKLVRGNLMRSSYARSFIFS